MSQLQSNVNKPAVASEKGGSSIPTLRPVSSSASSSSSVSTTSVPKRPPPQIPLAPKPPELPGRQVDEALPSPPPLPRQATQVSITSSTITASPPPSQPSSRLVTGGGPRTAQSPSSPIRMAMSHPQQTDVSPSSPGLQSPLPGLGVKPPTTGGLGPKKPPPQRPSPSPPLSQEQGGSSLDPTPTSPTKPTVSVTDRTPPKSSVGTGKGTTPPLNLSFEPTDQPSSKPATTTTTSTTPNPGPRIAPVSSTSALSTTTSQSTASVPTLSLLAPGHRRTWRNGCNRCDEDTGLHTCCPICRDYDAIDEWAIKKTLKNTIMADGSTTAEDYLAGCKATAETTQRDLERAKVATKTLGDEYDSAVNAFRELNAQYDKLLETRKQAITSRNSTQAALEKLKMQRPEPTLEIQKVTKTLEGAVTKVQGLTADCEEAQKKAAAAQASPGKIKANKEKAEAGEEALAKKIDLCVNDIVRQVMRRLLTGCTFDATDPLNRARFCFTWIANTIRYDKEETAKLGNMRGSLFTLINGYEVCRGYAELFKVMYDTDTPSLRQCTHIKGWASSGTTLVSTKEERAARKHSWNSVPLPGGRKVIDCTWGAGHVNNSDGVAAMLDPTWFTKPNEEFDRTHLVETQGIKESDVISFFSRPTLVNFFSHSQGFQVLKNSLKPDLYRIDWGQTTFSYSSACPHIPPAQLPACVLWVSEDDPDLSKPLKLADGQWFLPAGTGRWSVSVNLASTPFKTCDTVTLFAVFPNGQAPRWDGIPQGTTLSAPLSSYINGVPIISKTQYNETPEVVMQVVARWRRKGIERKGDP